jgi:hypothetical protein
VDNIITAQRLGDFNFFVPNASMPLDLAELIDNIPAGCPLIDYLTECSETRVLNQVIRIIPRRLSELRAEPAVFNLEGKSVKGVVFQLPDDVVKVMALWERNPDRPNYSMEWFWQDYRTCVGGFLAKLAETWLKKTLIDGVQAQAQTDIRLQYDQIGFAPGTMATFRAHVQEAFPHMKIDSIEGMWVISERFPVASEHGARMTQIVELPDAEEGLIYMNPEAWNDLQGGDTDGDQGYAGLRGKPQFDRVEKVGPYPQLEMVHEKGNPFFDLLIDGGEYVAL